MRVLVVAGPGLVADAGLLEEVALTEFASLEVEGRFAAVPGPSEPASALAAELDGAGAEDAIVVVPGPDPAVRRLMDVPAAHSPRTVWLDLARSGTLHPVGGAAHLQGRGVLGLVWAIRHAVYRLRSPARRFAYGDHADQWGELRSPLPAREPRSPAVRAFRFPDEPPGPARVPPRSAPVARGPSPFRGGGSPPVAVLVHGGYWRSVWGADVMDALAIDLAERGFASWNLEYRRPGPHGWSATTADVASGIAALAVLDVPLDLGRVAVIGHSAGGQLALRAAADTWRTDVPGAPAVSKAPEAPGGDVGPGAGVAGVRDGGWDGRVSLAVSLAGVVDLVEGDRRSVGAGAVAAALGGGAGDVPEVYAESSPFARLPLGGPQLVVQGISDDLDLVDAGRRYARAGGAEVVYLERPGDHFSVIDPATPIWDATAGHLAAWLLPRPALVPVRSAVSRRCG